MPALKTAEAPSLLTPIERRYVWDGERRHYEIGGAQRPGVTTVIDATSSKVWLKRWEERLGAEQAEVERKRAARRGTALHSRIEQLLLYGNSQLSLFDRELEEKHGLVTEVDRLWEIARPLVADLGEPVLIEGPVYWAPERGSDEGRFGSGFAGTIDCVVRCPKTGQLVCHDWKTSARRKRERSWISGYILQQAAYARAFEFCYSRLGYKIDRCQINIFPLEGGEPQVFSIEGTELKLAWTAFQHRLEKFHRGELWED